MAHRRRRADRRGHGGNPAARDAEGHQLGEHQRQVPARPAAHVPEPVLRLPGSHARHRRPGGRCDGRRANLHDARRRTREPRRPARRRRHGLVPAEPRRPPAHVQHRRDQRRAGHDRDRRRLHAARFRRRHQRLDQVGHRPVQGRRGHHLHARVLERQQRRRRHGPVQRDPPAGPVPGRADPEAESSGSTAPTATPGSTRGSAARRSRWRC